MSDEHQSVEAAPALAAAEPAHGAGGAGGWSTGTRAVAGMLVGARLEPPDSFGRRLARRPAQERAAVLGALSRGAGNAAVASLLASSAPTRDEEPEPPAARHASSGPGDRRVLQRQPTGGQPADPVATQTWQHPEVRAKAEAIEQKKKDAEKPKDRGLELYLQLVPAVVRAVKGYAPKDGKQIPLENAMLIIAQGTAEHGPYDPNRAAEPVIPPGNMTWGVTTESDDPTSTVRTGTTEESGGVRHTEGNRKFRSYGSMDEAAEGYLKALEGTDPAAAKNPSYDQILQALKKKGMTPEQFGATLNAAKYATTSDYGGKVAKIFQTAKSLVKKFMPQIKQAQQDKIDALQQKKQDYAEIGTWIQQKIDEIQQSNDETQQLEADRTTLATIPTKLDPLIQKEQQLLNDLGDFAATLGK